MTELSLLATAAAGVEPLVAEELRALGASVVRETPGVVTFSGSQETALRVCLWSRTAGRILLPLSTFPVTTPEELYERVREVTWEDHLCAEGTLAVDCTVSSSAITHSLYAAQKTKDAIVDRFRDLRGVRPAVQQLRPDLQIFLHIRRDRGTLGIDLSGETLSRRGYRPQGGEAPLRENLAAAILLYAKWPSIASAGGAFLDPMCGSGTFAIEAALLAGDVAPGLFREYFGFLGWKGFDAAAWGRLLQEAQARRAEGREKLPPLFAFDIDPRQLSLASANAERAGVRDALSLRRLDVAQLEPPAPVGLLAVNPPYGERLGEVEKLKGVYRSLGERLRSFEGWKVALFTGNPDLAREVAILPRRVRTLYNGPLECRLFHLEPQARYFRTAREERPARLTPGGEMFANRLRKNLKTVGEWARREGVSCYRLYDADMPEYAVAVDVYSDWDPASGKDIAEGERWLHVQEYEAPAGIDPGKAAERLREAMAALPHTLGLPPERIYLKVRRRQKGNSQYRKLAESGDFHTVREGGLRFLVNFADYLDTGLFLDHRITRDMLGKMAAGKRFLNLFGYTGTATVHAAAAGAVSTTTVDLSSRYLEWGRRNLELNRLEGGRHRFVRADCLEWLEREKGSYDLIFLDPPTFSSSKRMEGTLDVQRDQTRLLQGAAKLLASGGVLIFSTNNRRFRLDPAAVEGLEAEDITRATIPRDFARSPRIHSCWKIARR